MCCVPITEVRIHFRINSIRELDEVQGIMKTSGYLEFYWVDELLKWEASDHGNISYILLPQDEIWKPTISLYNSVVSHRAIGKPDLFLAVTDQGGVDWYPFQVSFYQQNSVIS